MGALGAQGGAVATSFATVPVFALTSHGKSLEEPGPLELTHDTCFQTGGGVFCLHVGYLSRIPYFCRAVLNPDCIEVRRLRSCRRRGLGGLAPKAARPTLL